DELQRVGGLQPLIVFLPWAVEEDAQPLDGAAPEVVRALGADVRGGGQVLVIDDLRARRTLDPQALGDSALLVRLGLNRLPDLLEPRHSAHLFKGCGGRSYA